MKLNVTAQLYYHEGSSVDSKWGGLYLYIKFRESGKLFKTTLERILVNSSKYRFRHTHSFIGEDYYDKVMEVSQDIDFLTKYVEDEVVKYLKHNNKISNDEDRRKNEIAKKINGMDKIEIKVEIK